MLIDSYLKHKNGNISNTTLEEFRDILEGKNGNKT
jgi:hypothetical protein